MGLVKFFEVAKKNDKMEKGIVYLVGAGPGDPGLVTLKAVECLRKADVVVYDYLANKKFLQYASPKTKKIYVGKKAGTHTLTQKEIESLLVKEASQGKAVVRLKGGDPFVFGRGGEEAEALARAKIPFEIIPGVTSAIAAPAYAGIPVTHRDLTSTVTFVTGHEKESGTSPDGTPPIDWNALAQMDSIVFLMGIGNLSLIVKNLTEGGRDPETPAAVVEWGTYPRQRTVVGTLRTIEREVQKEKIVPPAVIVVGSTVPLREKLAWFETRPLFGKRILVTRSRSQASALSKKLEEAGADVIEIPTIEIRPPSTWADLDRAIRSLSKYRWLIFTSINGVESFFGRLTRLKKDIRELTGIRIAAIGPATAKAVAEKGLKVDAVAEEYRAEGLLDRLGREKIKGARILIPRAAKAREVLVKELRKRGARVDDVDAYRAVPPRHGREELLEALSKGIDLLTFASSSTVDNFMTMVGTKGTWHLLVKKIPVASIGPITTDTAKSHGLNVVIQPKKYTILALVDAIVTQIHKES